MRTLSLLQAVLVLLCASTACDDKARLGGAEGGASGEGGGVPSGGMSGGGSGGAGKSDAGGAPAGGSNETGGDAGDGGGGANGGVANEGGTNAGGSSGDGGGGLGGAAGEAGDGTTGGTTTGGTTNGGTNGGTITNGGTNGGTATGGITNGGTTGGANTGGITNGGTTGGANTGGITSGGTTTGGTTTGGTTTGGSGGSTGGGGGSGGNPPWDGSLPDGMCTSDGWCWIYPTAPNLNFTSLAASGSSDIWGVMRSTSPSLLIDAGVIHFDGNRFRGVLGEVPDMNGIVATASSTAAWMLLEPKHQVRFWNGTTWGAPTALPTTGTLRAIWARNASDVWMVGDAGAVVHWNGTSFQIVNAGDASHDWKTVHGTGSVEVWIGGTPGLNDQAIRRFDGNAWADMQLATEVDVIWASGSSDVWAGGVAELRRWNGATWTTPKLPPVIVVSTAQLTHVAGAPDGRVWFNGRMRASRYLSLFWNGSSLEGYDTVAGPDSPVTFAQEFLTSKRFGILSEQPSASTLWSGSPTGGTELGSANLKPMGTAPYTVSPGTSDDTPPLALLPFSNDDMLLLTRNGAWRGKVGGTWTLHPEICTNGSTTSAPSCGGHELATPLVITGRSASDLWVVESPATYVSHWDGAAWSRSSVGGTVTQIVSTASDSWALSGTQVFHKGTSAIWDRITNAPDAERIVAGEDGALVAFSRGSRQIARYNGSTWTNLGDFSSSIGASEPLRCLRSQSSSSLQAVTSNGVWTFNGTTWEAKPGPLSLASDGQQGSCTFSGSRIWLPAGTSGILAFDGNDWRSMPVPLMAGWNEPGRVVVSPQGGAWALFPIYGMIYAYQPNNAF